MRHRLTEANIKRSDALLAEVESLLRTLDEGWTAMQHNRIANVTAAYAASMGGAGGISWSA